MHLFKTEMIFLHPPQSASILRGSDPRRRRYGCRSVQSNSPICSLINVEQYQRHKDELAEQKYATSSSTPLHSDVERAA